MEALGAVESAALAEQSPFEGIGEWNGIAAVNISKEGLETLGLRLDSGRWFEPEDEALSGDRSPVVMDRRLRRTLFGDQDPLGKTIDAEQVREKLGLDAYVSTNMKHSPLASLIVVGVMEDCLYYGKYGSSRSRAPGTLFFHLPGTQVSTLDSYRGVHLLLRTPSRSGGGVRRGASKQGVRAVVPADQAMRFSVSSLVEMRDSKQARLVQNLKNTALLSGLLMLMVALG